MQLRLHALRAIRCFSLNEIQLSTTKHFVTCIRPVEHNLKSANRNNIPCVFYQQYRCKWKRKGQQKKQDEDSDSDSDTERDEGGTEHSVSKETMKDLDPGTKLISYKMDSNRIDRLVRRALNISAKDAEELFYNKKIYVNDTVLTKKSQPAEDGDIITVPLQPATGSIAPGALIEVLEVKEETNGFTIKVARNKSTHVKI